ncbi:MAG: L-serine ammonia-lyase, iron-sulfur-dependent subunit beta [Spirochaetaceae bacterium]|jgi:L-serine dehydratase|nr:L-serine ammonia-lyase, iron-sulfur-dependent subunit beta [Spirochaetaceae bacterium]
MPKENVPLFEIFGPVMIGPSSSHTAGVARISYLARRMFGTLPAEARIRFYGSLASTWKGHGSGNAALAGLLGIHPEDEEIARGGELLKQYREEGKGFPVEISASAELPPSWHPNSMVIEILGRDEGQRLTIRASSIGGGSIRIDEIDGFEVNLSGELEALLVLHHDEIGVIAEVSQILAEARINIAGTSSRRREKGDVALLVVEADGKIPPALKKRLEDLPAVYRVRYIPSVGDGGDL